MPLRYTPAGGAAALHHLVHQASRINNSNSNPFLARLFTTTSRLHNDSLSSSERDHYETLEVSPNATPAEIKKSYFRLSKLHHPDLASHSSSASSSSSQNPPTHKFHLLSESYAILSHPPSRAAYDRTRPKYHHHPSQSSYSSTNPAGGRAPSGLSRRRTSFHGPPPSFYRSGGWGAHSAKRKAAHESSTAQTGSPSGHTSSDHQQQSEYYSKEKPGMGFGQGFASEEWDGGQRVPHFDSVAHERTHRRHEVRRAKRMAEKMGMNPGGGDGLGGEGASGWITSFAVVSGCLMAATLGGVMLGGIGGGEKNERERKDAGVAG